MKNLLLALFYAFLVCSSIMIAMVGADYIVRAAQADTFTTLDQSTVRVTGGTGSIVYGKSGQKYLLTNWHVCMMYSDMGELVGKFDEGENLSGAIVLTDPDSDLCAAKVMTRFPALTLSKNKDFKNITTKGYPGGVSVVSAGTVKFDVTWDYNFEGKYAQKCPQTAQFTYNADGSVRRCTMRWVSTLTTLFSRPGASGSPVVDDAGLLVGVISSHNSDTGNDFAGGMVPLDQLTKFLDRL